MITKWMVITGTNFHTKNAPPNILNPGTDREIARTILEQERTKNSREIFQKVLVRYECSSSILSLTIMVRQYEQ